MYLTYKMDLDALNLKLSTIQNKLNDEDKKLKRMTEMIKEHEELDYDDRVTIRQEYYDNLNGYEKEYQKLNDEYKDLISQFSLEYLELTDFYVGPELPRKTFLDSKKDVQELYFFFLMAGLACCNGFI